MRLTGLPNRFALHEHLDARAASTTLGSHFGLLLIDYRQFQGSERYASDTAPVTRSCVRSPTGCGIPAPVGALAARLGGDEFAVVFAGAAQGRELEQQAEQILDILRIPFTLGEREFPLPRQYRYRALPPNMPPRLTNS